jgi:hypothetical protein
MSGLVWNDVRGEFAFDGSWRDIYILNATLSDWQRMLDGLRASGFDLGYQLDGQPAEFPSSAESAFALVEEHSQLLSVRFAGILANCHFFTPNEIEFDIDPREITGQERLDSLLGFMQFLTDCVGKEVVLSSENCPESVIIRVRTAEPRIEHHSAGGWC